MFNILSDFMASLTTLLLGLLVVLVFVKLVLIVWLSITGVL